MHSDGGVRLFATPSRTTRKVEQAKRLNVTASPAKPALTASAQVNGKPLPVAQPSTRQLDAAEQQQSADDLHDEPVPKGVPAGAAQVTAEEGGAPPSAGTELPEGTTFRQLGLNDWLDKVCRSLGMTTPTEVRLPVTPMAFKV